MEQPVLMGLRGAALSRTKSQASPSYPSLETPEEEEASSVASALSPYALS
jgi:hypothetical protein